MKKPSLSRIAALVTAAATAVLVGCFKTDTKTTLNKDGSGVLTQRLEVDMSKMKELAEMFKGFAGDPGAPAMDTPTTPPAEDMTAEFKKMEDKLRSVEGLTVKEFTRDAKDGKVVIAYTVEFKEWSLLGKGGAFLSSVDLAKNADGSYTITFDPTSGQMGGGGGGAGGGGGDMPQGMDPSAFAPMLEPFLGSMEIATTLTLPGAITETNGTKSEDGSTVSWKLGFKDIIASKGGGEKVTFKGEGLELKPFKFVPDTEQAKEMFGGGHKSHPAGDRPTTPTPAPTPAPVPDGDKPK